MNKIQVALACPLKLEALLKLQNLPLFEVTKTNPDLADLTNPQTIEALMIRSKTKITRGLLERFPRLRFIITLTSGFDHIDLTATKEKSIAVSHTPEGNSQSVAELTWALLLACARKFPQSMKAVKQKVCCECNRSYSHNAYGLAEIAL